MSARGKAISLRQVTRNRSATERIKHDVTDLAQQPALADADIWQAEVDRSTGRVIVRMSRLTNAAADAIVAAYGTEDVAVIEEPNPEATDQFGRLSDSSSFWGGARIGVPSGSCTDAFSWNISSTVSGMLTAGHCIPNGGSVSTPTGWMGTVASGSRENYSSTGTVYLTGQSTYRGDMALIQVNSDKSSSPFIYRGGYDGTSSGRVTGMMSARSKSGDKYCTGGSYSGEICGWTVDAAGVDRKISDKWKRNIVVSKNRQGWCTRPGDSGGSVYIVNSSGTIQAKGINNSGGGGGSDYYGGALDPCHQQFTDIWDAYYGFPGTIKS